MTRLCLRQEKETQKLAQKFAEKSKKGDVFALYGNLGAGKTTFARAFIQTLCGKKTIVPSPTFTLLQIYEDHTPPIFHFDLYRLQNVEEVQELGLEQAFSSGITLIEWPQIVENILPPHRHKLFFQISEEKHYVEFSCTEKISTHS